MDWVYIGLFLSLCGLALCLPVSIALTNAALAAATAFLAAGFFSRSSLIWKRASPSGRLCPSRLLRGRNPRVGLRRRFDAQPRRLAQGLP